MFLVLPMLANALPSKVIFYDGSLNSAKAAAANEGKLYFAKFSASWCAPCRLLEETTFADPTVVNYVSKNYIPVKVDIDNFDGIALKQRYNVQTIPTIIVFNSKGELLEKYDESLPTSKMLALLKRHNKPVNRIKSKTRVETSDTWMKPLPSPPAPTSKPKPPVVRESHSPMKPATPSRPDKKPVTPPRVEDIRPSLPKPLPQGNGLYRFKVTNQASQGFSVQIGAFGQYGNVLRQVAKIQGMFDVPIIVHITDNGEREIYKILLGEFSSRKQAINYQSKIKNKGVEGVIKDLSTMK